LFCEVVSNEVINIVPGLCEKGNKSQQQSSIIIKKKVSSLLFEPESEQEFSYVDVEPSTSAAANNSVLFSQRRSSRAAARIEEYNDDLNSSIELLEEKFKRIDASSILSKREKSKLNQASQLIEKSKQIKRVNVEVEQIVTSKHVSKKPNVETLNGEIDECFSIAEMVQFAKDNKFPTKYFLVNKQLNQYTTILHFFESIRIIDLPNNKSLKDFNISWKCKICKNVKEASLGSTTNLNKHLRNKHGENELKDWFKYYDQKKNLSVKPKISKDHFNLILYIISSNAAIFELTKPSLARIVKFPLPSRENFRYNLLPSIMKKLSDAIEIKLQKAESICLIVDIWCKNSRDFISLAASVINKNNERSILTIDMQRMQSNHTAENVKKAIEEMINNKNFDKTKISGK
jgi:hypothetical protein